jgi:tryptophan synthase alpha chain
MMMKDSNVAARERIKRTFDVLAQHHQVALIPYLMAGFPTPQMTVPLMHAAVKSGANVIELGVPFSDPMADGPVIQKAGEKALAHGVDLAQVLTLVREFRQRDTTTPVVLMGYANPIEHFEGQHGADSFVQEASASGVDGLLVVDYPPEECVPLAQSLKSLGMDLIFLLAPTSTQERMATVAQVASGYVYYVSLRGITGAAHLDTQAVDRMLPIIREHVSIPVGVGFGIRNEESARAVAQVADAVVIGTRLLEIIEEGDPREATSRLEAFLHKIRVALDTPHPG